MSAHDSALAHHFDTLEQQHGAAILGMWAFLATEVLFFGGLFLGYTVNRAAYPKAFEVGSHHLDIVKGCVNTAVLIGSSLTMVLAVFAARHARREMLTGSLIATIVLGCAFLGIKSTEWTADWHERLVPGPHFDAERWTNAQIPAGQGEMFFMIYFSMTGLHAIHMIAGMAIIACYILPAWRGRYTADYYSPIEVLGLYWHFVDIVWIFLFPLFYLVGTRSSL